MNQEEILKEFTPERVALRLKKLMHESEISVQELSKKIYISSSGLYKTLNAKCTPNVLTLIYLSIALNTTIDYILLGR